MKLGGGVMPTSTAKSSLLDRRRPRPQHAGVTTPSVTAREARRLSNQAGWTFLDVRTEAEYADGHPAGAANVPVSVQTRKGPEANVDFLPVVEAVFPRSSKLIVGARDHESAARAADLLRAAGYDEVTALEGGYAAWVALGLPTETISDGLSYPDMRWRAFELRS